MKYKILLFLLFLIVSACSSTKLIPEPSLDQVSFKSETICTEFVWYSPFCFDNKSRSIQLKLVVNNTSLEKKFYLDYVIDSADTDLPVGISIQIDGTYYNLRKMGTDYIDILKLSSELTPEVLNKIVSSKTDFIISYSSRKETFNYTLSSSNSTKLRNESKELLDKSKSFSKLNIIK